ncbi:hypothetical protein EYF80_027390 [Liparis tanakae]|uniref:Uncharacterized protein n=1 Tax=Liparis tanakae TaxID=230148 RepID=A0A4Z2H985_9TELE|nr:hypothetical protein EYF80_027390 [Liparis tanakae]
MSRVYTGRASFVFTGLCRPERSRLCYVNSIKGPAVWAVGLFCFCSIFMSAAGPKSGLDRDKDVGRKSTMEAAVVFETRAVSSGWRSERRVLWEILKSQPCMALLCWARPGRRACSYLGHDPMGEDIFQAFEEYQTPPVHLNPRLVSTTLAAQARPADPGNLTPQSRWEINDSLQLRGSSNPSIQDQSEQ